MSNMLVPACKYMDFLLFFFIFKVKFECFGQIFYNVKMITENALSQHVDILC